MITDHRNPIGIAEEETQEREAVEEDEDADEDNNNEDDDDDDVGEEENLKAQCSSNNLCLAFYQTPSVP